MGRTTLSNDCLVSADLSWMLSYRKMPNSDSSNENISHNLSKHSEIGGIETIVLYQKTPFCPREFNTSSVSDLKVLDDLRLHPG